MVESKAAVQPSTTMDAPDLSKQPATDWDEAQIRKSLATLEQLQDQIDALRFVIPNITAAASTRNPSRAAYFANFQKASVGGSRQLNEFSKEWLLGSTQEILERARSRRQEDGNMSAAVDVQKYGWAQQDQVGG